MATINTSEYGKFAQIQNNSGSADAAAPEGGVYLFASGAVGSSKLYMQKEGSTDQYEVGSADLKIAGDGGTTGTVSIGKGETLTIAGGTGLDTAASSQTITFSVDLAEMDEAALAVADDYIVFLDGGTNGATKKEQFADVVTNMAGNGLAASNGVLAVGVDDSTIELNSDAARVKAAGINVSHLNTAVAGAGLAGGGGSALSVTVDDTGIEINSDTLRLKDDGVVTAKIADSNVTNAKLANSAVSVGSTSISLGASATVLAGLQAITASAIQVTDLDVVNLNSVTQTENTLEVKDKLIVTSVSASSANSAGGGLRIGGGQDAVGHAAILWDHDNTALDFNIGSETQLRLVNGHLLPNANADINLGSDALEFGDIYIDGTAYLDAVDIDGGAIDGATLGANSAVTITNADMNGGSIDGVAIGAASPSTIVGTNITVNTALLPDAAGGANIGSTGAEFGDVYIADDKKVQFGNDQDATIEYDADGTSELRFAGAAVTFEQNVSFDEDVTLGLSGVDVVNVPAQFTASYGIKIAGQTPRLVVGDGDANESPKVVFDGNAQDFHMGIYDVDDKFYIGLGQNPGATANMVLNSANRDVSFQGDIQIAGNQIADSGFSGANPVISFDGSQNTTFLGQINAGSGYASGGYTITTAGVASLAGDMNVGRTGGNGADFTVFGDTNGEKAFYAAEHNIFQVSGALGAGLQVSIGGDATTEYAIDVVNGSNNNNKVRAAAFVTYSDESLKSDVKSMSTALDTVMSLEGVEFTWKDSGERDFGFIAQDVQSVLPKAVHTADDGVQGVDYSRLTSILVEAVKAQQVQIEDLKKTITKLNK